MTTSENRHSVAPQWQTVLRAMLVAAMLIGLAHFPQPVTAAPASTWYVAATGNNANTCTSLATPCRTINFAVNKANAGDTINIAAGTYVENINLSKSLSLVGAGQTATIIDGGGIGPVALITSEGAGTNVNLSGLTLQNGNYGLGGGVHSESGNTGLVTISDSRIINNVAFTGGGGIFSQGNLNLVDVLIENNVNNGSQRGGGLFNLGTATLTGVSLVNNHSNLGGGIGNTGALTLTASAIASNEASDAGGGIYNGLGAKFISNNNTYAGNQAGGAGGAIYNAMIAVDTGSLITGSLAATSGGGIYNNSTAQLTLTLTTLHNNQAASTHGGGLYNDGRATLAGVTVSGNTAISGLGGGLYAAGANGVLSMADTVVSNNRSVNGGGLYAASLTGALTVINSQFTNNQGDVSGGGLYSNMTANLTLVTVSNNRAISGKGGGIYNAGVNSRLLLTQVTLDKNQAIGGDGGGIYNEATVNASDSTLTRNQAASGGGLYNNSAGRLTVDNSTWALNLATQGGGINNHGTLTLTQSTLYSNTTTLQGGSGLYNNASAQLTNVTLSFNSVLSATNGAILNDGGALDILNSTLSHNASPALARTAGSIALANTIVANSIGGDNCTGGPLISNGHNLDSGASCGLSATGDISSTDPLLGPLTNNGGQTFTRGLEVDSHAIDAGNNPACPSVDQRGIARPQGDACDIGAYETIGYTNDVTETIAAGGCITSTTVVSNSFVIGSLHVGANATFTPRGDLRIKLYAPDRRTVELLGATGGSGQDLDVLWDDDSLFGPVGTEDQDISVPYYNYVRVPDQSLRPLFGRLLRGAWQLELCNLSSDAGNVATLNRWSLLVPSVAPPKIYLPLVRKR
jgi:predicted outer membrane repeat protein